MNDLLAISNRLVDTAIQRDVDRREIVRLTTAIRQAHGTLTQGWKAGADPHAASIVAEDILYRALHPELDPDHV